MNESAKNNLVILGSVSVISLVLYLIYLIRNVDPEGLKKIGDQVRKVLDLIPNLGTTPASGGSSTTTASPTITPAMVMVLVLFSLTAWTLFRLKR